MSTIARPFPAARTAVITGAGSERGIGRALATRLAADGWSIAALDIDGAAVEKLAAYLVEHYNVSALGQSVDIAEEAAVNTAIDRIQAELPPVVGLANIAGISEPTPFLELTTQIWDRVMAVNLRGQYFMTRGLVPGMVNRRLGRVVNVSSVSAQRGGGSFSKVPYSAAKAGVLGLTRALAREVGVFGVTVNAVSPGPIDTDIMGGTLSEERRAEMISGLVVDRLGTVEDVAALMGFLMSEDAGFITGATYNINGGLIID